MASCFVCNKKIDDVDNKKFFCSKECLEHQQNTSNKPVFESKPLIQKIVNFCLDLSNLRKSLSCICRLREVNKTLKRAIEELPFEFGNLFNTNSLTLYHARSFLTSFINTCFKNDLLRYVYFGTTLLFNSRIHRESIITASSCVNTEFMRFKIAPLLHQFRPPLFFAPESKEVLFWSLKNSILPLPVRFRLTEHGDIYYAARNCVESGDADVCEEWLKLQAQDDVLWIIIFCFNADSETLLRELLVTRKISYPWQKRLMTRDELYHFECTGEGFKHGMVDLFRVLLDSGLMLENWRLIFDLADFNSQLYFCCMNRNAEMLDFLKDELDIPVDEKFYHQMDSELFRQLQDTTIIVSGLNDFNLELADTKFDTVIDRFKEIMKRAVESKRILYTNEFVNCENYFIRKTLNQYQHDHIEWLVKDAVERDLIDALPRGISYDMILSFAIELKKPLIIQFATIMGGVSSNVDKKIF